MSTMQLSCQKLMFMTKNLFLKTNVFGQMYVWWGEEGKLPSTTSSLNLLTSSNILLLLVKLKLI